jgi:hypothetical protein
MRFKSSLATFLAASTLTFSGCSKAPESPQSFYETVPAKPITVAQSAGRTGGVLAMVLEMQGRKVVAISEAASLENLAKAEALVQMEIDDGDQEDIYVGGWMNGETFEMNTVSVRLNSNLYNVNLGAKY